VSCKHQHLACTGLWPVWQVPPSPPGHCCFLSSHLCLLLDCCTTERNREPILAALKQHLPNEGLVLEIASGTGQHAAYFAAAVPTWQWQPTDVTDEGFDSIRAYTVQLPNVLPPLVLDASAPPQQWPSLKCAAVYVANVTHISPWCVCGLVFGLLLG
jgi:hypothetical protein